MHGRVTREREQFRRRSRRVGLIFICMSPVVAAVFGLLFRSGVGFLLGGLCLAVGLYTAVAYAPFAAWLRRREQSH